MPYIGNKPSTSFVSMTKQDLTGSSGGSVTLSHAVANANEIALYINNVRQEPTESYTVSGSTLNFNGYTVSASDDIYVIFLGKAIQTKVPPDGSVSTAKIADSAVTNAKINNSTIDLTTKVTGVLPVANGGGVIKNIAYVPINPHNPTGGAAYIPLDNTLPLITEGVQVVQHNYTPVVNTSTIFVTAYFTIGETANHINALQSVLFFNDTCVNVRSLYALPSGAGGSNHMYLFGSFSNSSGSDLDIEIRCSQTVSNVLTINGQNLTGGTGNLTVGTSAFGGANSTSATYITITEF